MTSARARTRLRLYTRDLAAAAAFASMAVSGQIPLLAVSVFGVGLLLALLDRRILAGRSPATALILVAGAIALYGGVATGRFDLVVAACGFASLLPVHRLLSAPTLDRKIVV